jgi:hypothetical protein
VHEIREHGYAFALFVSTIFYFLEKKVMLGFVDGQESKEASTGSGLSVSLQAEKSNHKR